MSKKSTDRLYESVRANARKKVSKEAKRTFKKHFKASPLHPIGLALDNILPGKNTLLEMPSNTKKGKGKSKGKSRARSHKPKAEKHPKPKNMKKGTFKRKGKQGGTAVSFAVSSQRGMRPKVKTLRVGQRAGLTLNGGSISGVCEITPSLQIAASGNNKAGNILALIPIHAQTIAPGTRLSDIAAMYDQYVFDKIWFELDCASNYIESGTLLGFVEANATDVIGAVNTQVGSITEWVDHGSAQIHPIAKGVLTFPRKGSYMKRISKGPKGGYYINTVIPTTSANSLSVSDCFQGQFCLMIHNPINTQGGQALNYPVDLGALRVHFTMKLREAAERAEYAGAADEHYSTSTSGGLANPMNWTAVVTQQSTLQVGSSLGLQSAVSGGNLYGFQLPVGSYFVFLTVNYAATGAADLIWTYYNTAQPGLTMIDNSTTTAKLSQGPGQNQTAFFTFKISTPGFYYIFKQTGTATGWTLQGYSKIYIMAMPNAINSLLKSKDLELRSLAWIDHQEKQDTTSDVLRAVRAELGLEQKKSTSEDKLQRKYQAILKERAYLAERQAKRFAIEEKEQKRKIDCWDAEEDDWDDPYHCAPDCKCPDCSWMRRQSKDPSTFGRAPALRIVQDDEKSDRGKGPREQPRASSLKS